MGKEIEVDAVCDGEDILIPGIMEHIERAGIHSGDSISVYPAQSISDKIKETSSRSIHRRLAQIAACHRTDQYPVYRVRRRGICHRGKSPFQPYGSVYQQGDRYSDRAAGNEGDPRT